MLSLRTFQNNHHFPRNTPNSETTKAKSFTRTKPVASRIRRRSS